MKLNYKCAICGVEYIKGYSLARHIINVHEIKPIDYYLKYIPKRKCKICGKETPFINVSVGYDETCSRKCRVILANKRREKSCLKLYNCKNVHQNEKIKKKAHKNYVKNCLKKHGVDNISKLESVKKKISKTVSSKECQQRTKETNIKHWGVEHHSKTEHYRKSCRKTSFENWGVYHPAQNKEVIDTTKKSNLEKYGYEWAIQNPEVYKRIFKNRKRPKSELNFEKFLKKNKIKFKIEYFISNEIWQHHFDFAIFKNNKLKCLVEIDGEYSHGLVKDCDARVVSGDKDYLRWELVPNKVKFLVIDSEKLEEGFEELKRILPMKYKDWKKEMLRSIPKNIEEAIPKFSRERMLVDWNRLCKYEIIYKNAFIGKSILLNFCKSRIINKLGNDWSELRKTLYKSPCSSHHLLEGFNIFKNTSELREKFREKYKGVKEVIVKHHSPEKMLAICSLSKTYISKELIDKESMRIIKFLKLKAFEL